MRAALSVFGALMVENVEEKLVCSQHVTQEGWELKWSLGSVQLCDASLRRRPVPTPLHHTAKEQDKLVIFFMTAGHEAFKVDPIGGPCTQFECYSAWRYLLWKVLKTGTRAWQWFQAGRTDSCSSAGEFTEGMRAEFKHISVE